MGTLAKIGIVHGKAVPIDGISMDEQPFFSPFNQEMFSTVGLVEFAEKIIKNKDFSVEEIEFLLTNVSLLSLFKLASLVSKDDNFTGPQVVPLVSLPYQSWLSMGGEGYFVKKAISTLTVLSYPSLNVMIDIADFTDLQGTWADLIPVVRDCQKDAILVGPSVDRINSWLLANESSRDREIRTIRLNNIIIQLKELGFQKLAPSAYRDSIQLLKSNGFTSSLRTRLERFKTPPLFARELWQLNQVIKASHSVDAWSIGESINIQPVISSNELYDLYIIKGLLVSSIVFKNAVKIGMVGRLPSPLVIGMAKKCCVTGPINGAVDKETAEMLDLPLYEELLSMLGFDDGGILA